MTVIEINNLTKAYGKKRGISNVNLRVNRGEIFGFIGPNGAGKSTTIKVLLNFIFPSSGEAKILGMDCVTDKKNVDDTYMKELCKTFEVELTKNVSELSLGNKKKVAIVQALIHKPKLLILDEPTNGLDPLMQQKLFKTLLKIREEGTTIFLSSHNLTEVEEFCDRVAIIKEGKIIEVRSIEDLLIEEKKLSEVFMTYYEGEGK
jgi:ABC-2 type transport system ATP-binding protein